MYNSIFSFVFIVFPRRSEGQHMHIAFHVFDVLLCCHDGLDFWLFGVGFLHVCARECLNDLKVQCARVFMCVCVHFRGRDGEGGWHMPPPLPKTHTHTKTCARQSALVKVLVK